MARGAYELEQEFIATAAQKTGHSLEDWLEIVQGTHLSKTKEITEHLKKNYSLNHMQATFITGIFLNGGQPVHDYEALFAKLFADKPLGTALYQAIAERIRTNLPENVVLIPTKNYVSIEGERVFACVKINAQNIRVGLDLGKHPFDERLVPAKGLGAMPNISHMIEVTESEQIDSELENYLQQAYSNRH